MKGRIGINLDNESTGSGDHFPAFCEITEQSISFSHDEFKQLLNNIKEGLKINPQSMSWEIIIEL